MKHLLFKAQIVLLVLIAGLVPAVAQAPATSCTRAELAGYAEDVVHETLTLLEAYMSNLSFTETELVEATDLVAQLLKDANEGCAEKQKLAPTVAVVLSEVVTASLLYDLAMSGMLPQDTAMVMLTGLLSSIEEATTLVAGLATGYFTDSIACTVEERDIYLDQDIFRSETLRLLDALDGGTVTEAVAMDTTDHIGRLLAGAADGCAEVQQLSLAQAAALSTSLDITLLDSATMGGLIRQRNALALRAQMVSNFDEAVILLDTWSEVLDS